MENFIFCAVAFDYLPSVIKKIKIGIKISQNFRFWSGNPALKQNLNIETAEIKKKRTEDNLFSLRFNLVSRIPLAS